MLKKILIVDDEPNNLQVLRQVLKDDYQLLFAPSGEKGVEAANTHLPDLILLDIMMPDMSGYEACEKLKSSPVTREIPVIFVTAMSEMEDEARGFDVGAVDYIQKPISPPIVRRRVQTHLQLYILHKKERDINRELEQRVEDRTKELVVATRAKDDFLAAMSHELRTPLTILGGRIGLLKGRPSMEAAREDIQVMEVAYQQQLELVSELLELANIENGEVNINESYYLPLTLLKKVDQRFRQQAVDAGLKLAIKNQIKADQRVLGDYSRILQILFKLLENAIKFTEHGKVAVVATVNEGDLTISVEDSGIGVPPELMDSIFDRFVQGDSALSRGFGGTGLGLFIASNLAKNMDGSVSVSSVQGEGSCFTLTLPYRPEAATAKSKVPEQSQAVEENHPLKGRVLLAEDTDLIQFMMRAVLEQIGLEVDIADNGQIAVDLSAEKHYDLILMDMQMPVMDGIEATKIIRERGDAVLIVALTANVMQKHRDAFFEAGCDGFISKPIVVPEFTKTIQGYLTQAEAEPPLGELSTTREFLQTYNNDHTDIKKTFIDESKKRREEISQALSNNWHIVRDNAHEIRGSVSTLGYPHLTEAARAVCDAIDQGENERISGLTMVLIREIDEIL